MLILLMNVYDSLRLLSCHFVAELRRCAGVFDRQHYSVLPVSCDNLKFIGDQFLFRYAA